jgi:hypothetical protein
MVTTIMMVKISPYNLWVDIHNRSNTEGRDIDTPEKAMQIIDLVYNEEMVIQEYIVTDTTISVVAQNDVSPCTNCQNTP